MVDEARVTQQYVEVAIDEDSESPFARVTQQYVEVILKYFYAVKTLPASDISAYSVKLNGSSETLNCPALTGPNTDLTVQFEYSTDFDFVDSELSVPFLITEIGNFYDFVEVDFTNFYYFRAIATDGLETWYGHIETFLATDYYYQELSTELGTGTLDGVEVVGSNLQLISGNLTGNRISPELDISELEYISLALLKWSSSEPTGTEIIIELRVSDDSGENWTEWEEIVNDSFDIFSFFLISDTLNALFQIRQTLTTEESGITPTLSELEVFIAESYLSPPIFNPSGGDHYANQYISLSCPTENAEIYYTLDGSDPLENGILYEDDLWLIEDGLVIRAYSYLPSDGIEDEIFSPVRTNTYNIVPFPESEYKLIHAYRFRNDDGNETTATWKENENIDLEELADTSLRMRVGFSGQEDVGPQKLQLDYRIKRADEVTYTDWRIVPSSIGYFDSIRIIETGDIRITEIGDVRIIEGFEETEGS